MTELIYSGMYSGTSISIMMSNINLNNMPVISLRSVLMVEKTGVFEENHRPAASHLQTGPHNVAWRTPRHQQNSNS